PVGRPGTAAIYHARAGPDAGGSGVYAFRRDRYAARFRAGGRFGTRTAPQSALRVVRGPRPTAARAHHAHLTGRGAGLREPMCRRRAAARRRETRLVAHVGRLDGGAGVIDRSRWFFCETLTP